MDLVVVQSGSECEFGEEEEVRRGKRKVNHT